MRYNMRGKQWLSPHSETASVTDQQQRDDCDDEVERHKEEERKEETKERRMEGRRSAAVSG